MKTPGHRSVTAERCVALLEIPLTLTSQVLRVIVLFEEWELSTFPDTGVHSFVRGLLLCLGDCDLPLAERTDETLQWPRFASSGYGLVVRVSNQLVHYVNNPRTPRPHWTQSLPLASLFAKAKDHSSTLALL